MPASAFCCGGECGAAGTIGQHWTFTGAVTFSTAKKRSGDRSIRLNGSGSAVGASTTNASATWASNAISVVRVFAWFDTLPDVDWDVVSLLSGGAGLRYKASDQKIYAFDGSATLGSSGVTVNTGAWIMLEILLDQSANPWTIDGKVNGTNVGQLTKAVPAGSSVALRLGANGTGVTVDVYFDDLRVDVGDAGVYPIGSGKVEHFISTADGTHNIAGAADFQRGNTGTDILNPTTTAFQLVDDVPLKTSVADADCIRAVAPPNASDYVELVIGPAPGISAPTSAPRSVEVLLGYHQAATQSGNIRVAVNDNGSLDDVLNLTAAGVTSIRYARKHYADPPSAATAWHSNNDGSDGDFRDLRVRFFSSDAAPDQMLDTLMVEAEFLDSPDITLSLSGVAATGAVGTLGQTREMPLTGVSATGAVGSVIWQMVVNVALTGVSATGNVGSVAHVRSVSLSGPAATASVGSVGIDRSSSISGASASASVGNLTATPTFTLSGNQATGSVGSLLTAIDTGLLGVSASGNVGSVNVSTTVPVSGNEATGAVGSVTYEAETGSTVALSGVSASAAVGSLTPQSVVQLSGVQAVSDLGVFGLSKSGSAQITGVEATSTAGSVGPEIATALSGINATSDIGTLSAERTIQISTVSADGLVGDFSTARTVGISGVQATSDVGSLGLPSGTYRTLKMQRTAMITSRRSAQFGVSSGRTSATVKHDR